MDLGNNPAEGSAEEQTNNAAENLVNQTLSPSETQNSEGQGDQPSQENQSQNQEPQPQQAPVEPTPDAKEVAQTKAEEKYQEVNSQDTRKAEEDIYSKFKLKTAKQIADELNVDVDEANDERSAQDRDNRQRARDIVDTAKRLELEAAQVVRDFPEINPDHPDYNPELAAKMQNLYLTEYQQAQRDETTNEVYKANGMYKLYETVLNSVRSAKEQGIKEGRMTEANNQAGDSSSNNQAPNSSRNAAANNRDPQVQNDDNSGDDFINNIAKLATQDTNTGVTSISME